MKFNPYFEVILAAIIWGTTGLFIKYLNLHPTVIAFFRAAVPIILLLLFFQIKKIRLFQGNNKLILIASFFNAVRMLLYFIGFTYTSIGNAVIILYTWPIFTTIFSIIFLKEKIKNINILLLLLAFIGITLTYINKEFSFADKDFIGMSAVLLSSMVFSLTVIIFKKELKKYSKSETVFYQNLIAAIIFLPFLFIIKPFPTTTQIAVSIFYAILIGLIGFGLFFSALKKIKASTASFLSYIEVISAVVLATIFFNERLEWNVAAGGLLIIGSAILLKKE